MKNILNITNGDCAVNVMKEAKIPGVFLPWRDVLHDGPIPKDLCLEELSQIRTKFIVDRGWGTPERISQDFIERDQLLKSFGEFDKIILWFEHDLYDQLQLLQVLDWFFINNKNEIPLSLICRDIYLGPLSPDELKNLLQYEKPISDGQLSLASLAWSAFRDSSPMKWFDLLNTDTSSLPFLESAIIRLLEEYPNSTTGLSRTAQQALKIISEGEKFAGKVFAYSQEYEDSMFMGDSSFWVILHELLESTPPLIKLPDGKKLTLPAALDQELLITPAGMDVLSGKNNWLNNIALDRWIGGVHLQSNNIWCWNSDARLIVKMKA